MLDRLLINRMKNRVDLLPDDRWCLSLQSNVAKPLNGERIKRPAIFQAGEILQKPFDSGCA
jgi:hypothetical protein